MEDFLRTKKILTYDDVVAFDAGDNSEQLVDIRAYDPEITTQYIKFDMLDYTGDVIYARETIARKIARVDAKLAPHGYKLKVVYGYRHPEVQTGYFMARQEQLKLDHPELASTDLERLTHNFVAVPSVAGHPAGAAVDLTLIDNDGNPIDMGTGIADYSNPEKIPTFAQDLSDEQRQYRALLHDTMVSEDFAPFYGEWWHFSYGDREWAAFYNKKALYGPIDFRA